MSFFLVISAEGFFSQDSSSDGSSVELLVRTLLIDGSKQSFELFTKSSQETGQGQEGVTSTGPVRGRAQYRVSKNNINMISSVNI